MPVGVAGPFIRRISPVNGGVKTALLFTVRLEIPRSVLTVGIPDVRIVLILHRAPCLRVCVIKSLHDIFLASEADRRHTDQEAEIDGTSGSDHDTL